MKKAVVNREGGSLWQGSPVVNRPHGAGRTNRAVVNWKGGSLWQGNGVVSSRPAKASFYAYLRKYEGCNLEELRVQVASEYAELFVGPRPPLAPLYESVYLGSPSRLFTEQTMSVRRFYERCGLAVVKDGKIPDDHIAYELELMATLVSREADAIEAGRTAAVLELQRLQREFLVVHLGGWLGPFASRIAKAPCAGFYDALARFARDFVSEDDATLGASIRELENFGGSIFRDETAPLAETA